MTSKNFFQTTNIYVQLCSKGRGNFKNFIIDVFTDYLDFILFLMTKNGSFNCSFIFQEKKIRHFPYTGDQGVQKICVMILTPPKSLLKG